MGPDFNVFGSHEYVLPSSLFGGNDNVSTSHELLIITESWGLNRQPFIMNDIRNSRGIISASLTVKSGFFQANAPTISNVNWYISGVDVCTRTFSFDVSGIPVNYY